MSRENRWCLDGDMLVTYNESDDGVKRLTPLIWRGLEAMSSMLGTDVRGVLDECHRDLDGESLPLPIYIEEIETEAQVPIALVFEALERWAHWDCTGPADSVEFLSWGPFDTPSDSELAERLLAIAKTGDWHGLRTAAEEAGRLYEATAEETVE